MEIAEKAPIFTMVLTHPVALTRIHNVKATNLTILYEDCVNTVLSQACLVWMRRIVKKYLTYIRNAMWVCTVKELLRTHRLK